MICLDERSAFALRFFLCFLTKTGSYYIIFEIEYLVEGCFFVNMERDIMGTDIAIVATVTTVYILIYLCIVALSGLLVIYLTKRRIEAETKLYNKNKAEHARYCTACGRRAESNFVFCVNCGKPLVVDAPIDLPSVGLNLLSFYIPVAGLIIYYAEKDKTPKKAKDMMKWGFIGLGVIVGLKLLDFLFTVLSL